MKRLFLCLMLGGMVMPAMAAQICLPINSNDVGGITCEFFKPLEGQSDWGTRCGGTDFNGVSRCGLLDSDDTVTGKIVESVRSNGNVEDNKSCYCKIVQPVVSRWVYMQTHGTAGDCSYWCQEACAAAISNNADFRNGIFSQLFE